MSEQVLTQASTPAACAAAPSVLPRRGRWVLALAGQFCFLFALVALSGPGRIDVVDGQTRYEVARSLVDHGDSVIRDPHVWFAVARGRGGARYTNYRLPQTVGGVAALWAADATGPVNETRRHFFFALTGALAGAVLAVTYSVWFRHLGHAPASSLAWGTAGLLCTPSWYYATSTFDDILGAATVVAAVAVAWLWRERKPLLGATLAGLLMGWAFHCKPPLAVFILPVMAAGYSAGPSWRAGFARVGLVWLGLLAGAVGNKVYQDYKFPPGLFDPSEFETTFGAIWTGNPLPGLASMALSPSCGALWYCPPLLLAFYGWGRWRRTQPWFCGSVLAASAIFVFFLCFLRFFKGEPCWGPRYLTPVFALWWIFVPASIAVLRPLVVVSLLGLGVLVQLLALSVDPQRLFFQAPLPFDYYVARPWLGFHTCTSHLCNRPRELVEVLARDRPPARASAPAPVPTHAGGTYLLVYFVTSTAGQLPSPYGVGPLSVVGGMQAIPALQSAAVFEASADHYLIFRSPRPWWAWQPQLAADERPIDPGKTFALLAGLSLFGLGLMVTAGRRAAREQRGGSKKMLGFD